jgi:hypothetical protein
VKVGFGKTETGATTSGAGLARVSHDFMPTDCVRLG